MRGYQRYKVVTYNLNTGRVSTSVDNMLDMLERSAAVLRKNVYIVLENSCHGFDPRIHGVYTTREAAENRRNRLHKVQIGGGYGHICVLKFRIKGQ